MSAIAAGAVDTFDARLRAAVRAGAWLLFVPFGLLLLQWFVYLGVMQARPAWVLSMMGPGVDWVEIRAAWLLGMVALKLLLWTQVMLVLWGAAWASLLGRRRRQGAIGIGDTVHDVPSPT
jgi:hypothetical protein